MWDIVWNFVWNFLKLKKDRHNLSVLRHRDFATSTRNSVYLVSILISILWEFNITGIFGCIQLLIIEKKAAPLFRDGNARFARIINSYDARLCRHTMCTKKQIFLNLINVRAIVLWFTKDLQFAKCKSQLIVGRRKFLGATSLLWELVDLWLACFFSLYRDY